MSVSTFAVPAILGFGASLSLIASIGPQNLFLIRQGIYGRHVGLVTSIFIASETVLIGASIAGLSRIVAASRWAETIIAIAGAAFLYTYAALAGRRALRSVTVPADTRPAGIGVTRTCVAAIGVTWMNPQAFVETVVVIGAAATTQGTPGQWWFAAGALAAAAAWFLVLGYGIRLVRPVFDRSRTWQMLDGLTALVMGVLATAVLASAW